MSQTIPTHGQRIGYIRVSALDQRTDRQLEGEESLDRVFTDHASGRSTDRPALRECLGYVRAGDTLVVHSMDRLARNLDDLRKLVQTLTRRAVAVEFVTERLTFTGEDTPMATLLLSGLGAMAEFERALIRERQREGIALAKRRGAYRGRKKSLNADQVRELQRRAQAGEAKTRLAQAFGISRETVYQYLRAGTAAGVAVACAPNPTTQQHPVRD